jgi:hypothetical protein
MQETEQGETHLSVPQLLHGFSTNPKACLGFFFKQLFEHDPKRSEKLLGSDYILLIGDTFTDPPTNH